MTICAIAHTGAGYGYRGQRQELTCVIVHITSGVRLIRRVNFVLCTIVQTALLHGPKRSDVDDLSSGSTKTSSPHLPAFLFASSIPLSRVSQLCDWTRYLLFWASLASTW
jgi:hypothetical protein